MLLVCEGRKAGEDTKQTTTAFCVGLVILKREERTAGNDMACLLVIPGAHTHKDNGLVFQRIGKQCDVVRKQE
jgi:hypothetical protein